MRPPWSGVPAARVNMRTSRSRCSRAGVHRSGQPGATVVADGQQSTRENRLTAWAEGLASTVEAQRHELRRARMELVAAQEVPPLVPPT